MRDDGRQVHGIARGWKQAVALRESGVEQKDVAAVSVFLNREKKGRINLDSQSVVIIDELSQIDRADMLALLRLQQKHGFTMLAIGDHKQAGSIGAPVMNLLIDTLGDKVPQILTSVRQSTERERTIAGLFRDGEAGQAIAMKRKDGTAELVAGGRDPTIKRVADKWMALTTTDPTLQPTIGVATNRDAHAISVAIRHQLQDAGTIKPDQHVQPVLMRGEDGPVDLALAPGDRVRVFNRIWSDGHFASNGDTLTVMEANKVGMRVTNDAGAEAAITWSQLTGMRETTPSLAYGHALTIDAAQGVTSRVHIDAVLSGSWTQQGGKAYVNESRHVEATHMIINEAAERRKIHSRVPRGSAHRITSDEVWKHIADNLSRQTIKATASDFMRNATQLQRGSVASFARALEPAERREIAGEERMTLRQRMGRIKLEMEPAIQKVVQLAQDISQQLQHTQRAHSQRHRPRM